MGDKKNFNILNLFEALDDFLLSYINKNNYVVFERKDVTDIETLDYIITGSLEQARETFKEYDVSKNEIEIICYENSENIRDLLLLNSRMLVHGKLENDILGKYMLHKFFSKEFSIHLDESFRDSFQNIKKFSVTNHLSTGASFDELAVDAFEADFNLVSLRSFVDHIVYYFMYLKQSGLASIPLEFEYAHDSEYFVINVHAPVKNFVAEYMMDSFGAVNSQKPLDYLLGVIFRTCDFLDLTYLENPGKVIMTGFFSKKIVKNLKGLVFNNILTAAQISRQVDSKIQDYIPQTEKNQVLENKQDRLLDKKLPAAMIEMIQSPAPSSILAEHSDKMKNIIKFMLDEFKEIYPNKDIGIFTNANFESFSGKFSDLDFIEGLTPDDIDYLTKRIQKNELINAYDEEVSRVREEMLTDWEVVDSLQGTLNSELAKEVTKKIDVTLLNSILSEENPEELDRSKKNSVFGEFTPSLPTFLSEDAFENISHDFAAIGSFDGEGIFDMLSSGFDKNEEESLKPLEELNSYDFEKSLPKFERDSFSDLLPQDPADFPLASFDNQWEDKPCFKESFKEKLELNIKDLENSLEGEEHFVFSEKSGSDENIQHVIRKTIQETLDEEFSFSNASLKEIEDKESLLVSELSSTFKIPEDEAAMLVKGASKLAIEKENAFVVKKLQGEVGSKGSDVEDTCYEQSTNSKSEAVLISKLKSVESENKMLKTNLSAMELNLSSTKIVQNKFEDIINGASDDSADAVFSSTNTLGVGGLDSAEKDQVIVSLKNGEALGEDEIEKLKITLSGEGEALERAKNMENLLRKEQLKSEKKDELFQSELQKAQQAIETKSLVLEKTKSSMKEILEKKMEEVSRYKEQVNDLNQKLNTDQNVDLLNKVKSLTKIKDNLTKAAELYKVKLDTLSKNLDEKGKGDKSQSLAGENLELKRLKIQVENQLNAQIKENKASEGRLQKMKRAESNSRIETMNSTAELKRSQSQVTLLKEQNANLVHSASSTGSLKIEKVTKELEAQKSKSEKLQGRVESLNQKLNEALGGDGEVNPQLLQLELDKSGKELELLKDKNQQLCINIEELHKKYKDSAVLSPSGADEGQASRDKFFEEKAGKEMQLVKGQNEQLQLKIKELVGKIKKAEKANIAASEEKGSAKEQRLTESVKNMKMEIYNYKNDIIAKKKETVKAKNEVTGLRNQVTKLKKDLGRMMKSDKGSKKAA